MTNPVEDAVSRMATDLGWLADQRYLAQSTGNERVSVSLASLAALDQSLRETLEVVVAIRDSMKANEASADDPLSEIVARLKANASKAQESLSAQALAAASGQRTTQ